MIVVPISTSIVPTHVGVNRGISLSAVVGLYCPHARGGEPKAASGKPQKKAIVPTHVGVNRILGADRRM